MQPPIFRQPADTFFKIILQTKLFRAGMNNGILARKRHGYKYTGIQDAHSVMDKFK